MTAYSQNHIDCVPKAGDPFVPDKTHRGFAAELRNRESPEDAAEMGFDFAHFSTNRVDAEAYATQPMNEGWEARVLPAVAELSLATGNFTLHRLH